VDVTAGQLGSPVDLRSRFAPQRAALVALLDGLSAEEWQRPTACAGWTVADLAAHVLGDVVGRASGHGAPGGPVPAPDEPIGAFIDRINEEWVAAWRRADPRLVVECLRTVGPVHDERWRAARPDDDSLGVSWAGIDPAPLWFDVARDFTEYWVHERQIRDAVGRPDDDPATLRVVLDVFARGLPSALDSPEALGVTGFCLVADPLDAAWSLAASAGERRWRICADPLPDAPVVRIDAERLWRRWTRQPGAAAPPPAAPALERAVLAHVAIVHSAPDP
jgi:uncharacterized protein (TIGR03083 family)